VLALKIPKYGWIEVGLSLMDYEAQMHKIRIVFAMALLVMVVLGVLVGWLQLRSVFQSVEKVRSTAIGISKGDMSRRVELANNGQELSDLAESFNSMLDRIQLLLKEMRDVSDHIAHDLRTPVSRIRGMAETALMTGEKMSNMQTDAFSTIVDEANQLGEMINTMLEISQTDAGLVQQQHEVVNLSVILHEGHDLFLPVAEDAGVTLSIVSPIYPMKVKGSKIHLQRAIANLIDNAIKFSPESSHISLSTEQDNDNFIIHICDDGIGISPEDKAHIFDRFYRSDQSRSKPGNGLGLSYSMSIIRNHGGNINDTSAIGEGSTFIVTLPRA
jgi:signal transduction histidine kinase